MMPNNEYSNHPHYQIFCGRIRRKRSRVRISFEEGVPSAMKMYETYIVLCVLKIIRVQCAEDYNVLRKDGSYEFGYDAHDSFHHSQANRNNVVQGQFGGRNPGTGVIDSTSYTAGPRGFRPRGKNIARKYDLSQSGPRPVGSRDDPYFDPNEDPSYNFAFRTRTYNREENANRVGDVTGKFSYLDDIGERHNVEYIAGKNTGFHVRTPFPDSNPRAYGPLFFNGRGKPIPRGRTAIQRGLDGSYKFISAGPDQRRTETSDATGHVRGSYTYLDDKGVQHSVHYIAGPEIGYRVLKNVKGPHLPSIYPFRTPEIIPPNFYDDLNKKDDFFDTAASGPIKPLDNNKPGGFKPFGEGFDDFSSTTPKPIYGTGFNNENRFSTSTNRPSNGIGDGTTTTTKRPFDGNRPYANKPSYDYDDSDDDIGDLFGGTPSITRRPESTTHRSTLRPISASGSATYGSDTRPDDYDDGSYKQSSEDVYKSASDKPNYDDDYNGNDVNGDFDLFGNVPKRKPTTQRRPFQIGIGVGGNSGGGGGGGGGVGGGVTETTSIKPGASTSAEFFGRHTIVTNIGDKLFSVPPGVSVRAHVQAIDLFPINSKIPSPSEQYKEDTKIPDTDNAESNNVPSNKTHTTEHPATTTTISSLAKE